MNWYVAELIAECRVGRARPTLWDQQLVVLRARGPAAAYAAAMTLRRAAQITAATSDVMRWGH